MTKFQNREDRIRVRAWTLALLAIVGWAFLAGRSAHAQDIQVPSFVLAQVLGSDVAREEAPKTSATAPKINLVAHQMRARFEDQIVAGVSRPSVELEVHFDFDSDVIHEESTEQIEAAATMLSQHFSHMRFRVAGYTDVAGDENYNQVLSERRAQAVFNKMVEEYGVDAERLESVGFGEDADGSADNAQRRRVELQIVRMDGAGA